MFYIDFTNVGNRMHTCHVLVRIGGCAAPMGGGNDNFVKNLGQLSTEACFHAIMPVPNRKRRHLPWATDLKNIKLVPVCWPMCEWVEEHHAEILFLLGKKPYVSLINCDNLNHNAIHPQSRKVGGELHYEE